MSPAPIAAGSIQQAPQLDIVLKPTRIDPAAGTGEVDVGMTITGVSAAQGAVLLAHQPGGPRMTRRSEEHTSELQSLMRNSYAVFCMKKKTNITKLLTTQITTIHTYVPPMSKSTICTTLHKTTDY